jgi:5'-nucleotidase
MTTKNHWVFVSRSLTSWIVLGWITLIAGAGVSLATWVDITAVQCSQKQITILGTNDLHGAVEPSKVRIPNVPEKTVGGMSFWSGVVDSIRKGIRAKMGDHCGGVLVVDGGDQFQGTLLSNFSEGELMFDLMNRVGYDAVVPGNHDYDFGPQGWLEDQVSDRTQSKDPRGVINSLAARAKFNLISANTYLKNSLLGLDGKPVVVESVGCTSDQIINWSQARRVEFAQPYVIKTVAMTRVALIGLDNIETPNTTTAANVSDLCFRDPFIEYMALRQELDQRADVFVIVMHEGDSKNDFKMSSLVKKILAANPRGVDAVVAGHTHFVNEVNVEGVPAIQSGANGEKFGRIDLFYDTKNKQVDRTQTKFVAGAFLDHQDCDIKSKSFCQNDGLVGGVPRLVFEGKNAILDQSAQKLIDTAKNQLAPMADRVLGNATQKVIRDRINESPLANALTDSLLEISGADISVLNTGGIRTDLAQGPITYENLYRVLPFGNHAVVLSPMDSKTLVRLVKRAVATCGGYGALMFSGISVQFERDCTQPGTTVDTQARLIEIKMTKGRYAGMVIYDGRGTTPVLKTLSMNIATLDFLASGGSGYDSFIGVPVLKGLGIFREALVDKFLQTPVQWTDQTDGRWTNHFTPKSL